MNKTFSKSHLLHSANQVSYTEISLRQWREAGVEVKLRRDDLIDDKLSGNKLYKLYFNLAEAQLQGKRTLVSFGGAYSNHLYALAAAGQKYGFHTVGIVRGEAPSVLSPTLVDAKNMGMDVQFVTREYYRKVSRDIKNTSFPNNYHVIPEGGANAFGIQGAKIIGKSITFAYDDDYDAVCLAVGTGSTMAGLTQSLPVDKTVIGFSVLKGNDFMFDPDIDKNSIQLCKWRMIRGFHGGGYGKKLPAYLVDFWRKIEKENNLLIDPVYTLKMLWGIHSLILQRYWRPNTKLLAIHTGGVQGRRGFNAQLSW